MLLALGLGSVATDDSVISVEESYVEFGSAFIWDPYRGGVEKFWKFLDLTLRVLFLCEACCGNV